MLSCQRHRQNVRAENASSSSPVMASDWFSGWVILTKPASSVLNTGQKTGIWYLTIQAQSLDEHTGASGLEAPQGCYAWMNLRAFRDKHFSLESGVFFLMRCFMLLVPPFNSSMTSLPTSPCFPLSLQRRLIFEDFKIWRLLDSAWKLERGPSEKQKCLIGPCGICLSREMRRECWGPKRPREGSL